MRRSLPIIFVQLCLVFLMQPLWGEDIEALKIKENPTFHRKIEEFQLSFSPEQLEYMLDNFPLAAYLMSSYGIYALNISREGERLYRVVGESSLEGSVILLKSGERYREYMGSGKIRSSLIGDIRASVVASIRYRNYGRSATKNDMEFWVRVDDPFLDLLCRIFMPLLDRALDEKLKIFIKAVQEFADKASSRPALLLPLGT
jgi:hypothetical protein